MSAKSILITTAVVAIGLISLVLFLSGGGETMYVKDDAVVLRERGEHLLNQRRHTTDKVKRAELLTEAIQLFTKAIELKPDFSAAHNMLGHCFIERGQWQEALRHLNDALKLRPDYPAALYNRAKVYQRMSVGQRDKKNLLDKAITDYQAALQSELSASFASDLHKSLADAYYQNDDIKSAIEELKRYLTKAPHAPDAGLVRQKIRGLQLMLHGQAPPVTAPLE